MAEGEHDDVLLTRFALRRDEAAFAALVERHGPPVLAACRRLCGNAADADDVFQAVFLTLATRAGALKREGSLCAWLHGVARHVALRQRASGDARRRRERSAAPARAEGDAPPQGDVAARLDDAVAALPERYRAPLLLHYGEGLDHAAIARALRLRPGTVAVRLSRARDLLRDRLLRAGTGAVGPEAIAADADDRARAATAARPLAAIGAALTVGGGAPLPSGVAQAMAAARRWLALARLKVAGAAAAVASFALAALIAARGVGADAPQPPAPAPAPPGVPAPKPADDREWVSSATSGWTAGDLMRSDRAFLLQTWVGHGDAPDDRLAALPAVRAGALADAIDWSGDVAVADRWTAPPYGQSAALRRLALGGGWSGARVGARIALVLLSAPLDSDERCAGYLVARDGATITCIVDAWTQDSARKRDAIARRALLVDLGALPAGDYAVRVLVRTFHRGAGDAHYAPSAFAAGVMPLRVAATAAAAGAPSELAQLDAVVGDAGGPAWITRGGRQPPSCLRLTLDAVDDELAATTAMLGLRRFRLAAWLARSPRSDRDLPPAEDAGERYAVVVGPALPRDVALTVEDAFWLDDGGSRPAKRPPTLITRLDLWRGGGDGVDGDPVRTLLLLPIDPQVPADAVLSVDWRVFAAGATPGGFDLTHEFSTVGAPLPGGWSGVGVWPLSQESPPPREPR